MDEETTKQLKKLWETNAYPSLSPLYKLARRHGLHEKTKDVDTWLKDRASTSLLQQRKEPYAVAGTFNNTTEPLQRVYLDLWDMSTHPSPDGFKYIMVLLDSFTRKAWAEPMKSKLPDDFMAAYKKIEKRLGKPVLLFVDKEGASIKVDRNDAPGDGNSTTTGGMAGNTLEFEAYLTKQGTILKRKVGRNDLATLDS